MKFYLRLTQLKRLQSETLSKLLSVLNVVNIFARQGALLAMLCYHPADTEATFRESDRAEQNSPLVIQVNLVIFVTHRQGDK